MRGLEKRKGWCRAESGWCQRLNEVCNDVINIQYLTVVNGGGSKFSFVGFPQWNLTKKKKKMQEKIARMFKNKCNKAMCQPHTTMMTSIMQFNLISPSGTEHELKQAACGHSCQNREMELCP